MQVDVNISMGSLRKQLSRLREAAKPHDLDQDGELLDSADVDLRGHATERDIILDLSKSTKEKIASDYCGRDHVDEYGEPREDLDPRDLGEFVRAVSTGDRVSALSLASRLFIDREIEAVEAALFRMKMAA